MEQEVKIEPSQPGAHAAPAASAGTGAAPPMATQPQGPRDARGSPESQPEQRRKVPKVRSEGESSGAEGDTRGFRPFSDLAPGALHVWVKDGSKIRSLLAFAATRMEQPATRAIVFSGVGHAACKTVSCAEILKRRLGGLHQVTRLRRYSTHELGPAPPPLAVSAPRPGPPDAPRHAQRTVPGLAILLSKDPLNPRQLGYQPPNPQSGPSIQPAAPTSGTAQGEPTAAAAAAAGSANGSSPPPGVPPEDPRD